MNMNRLPLEKIDFGKTDAYTELCKCGTDYFVESFVSNPKYHASNFIDGKKYLICGKKGTGKTAFLRYLECSFMKNPENLVFSIRFKSDIDEIDKDGFEAVAYNDKTFSNDERYDSNEIIDCKSYELVWKTFLINQIISRSKSGEYSVFVENEDYRLLLILLKCVYGEEKEAKIIMPKIKRGSIELTASFAELLSSSIKLELDFDAKKKRINYQKISKKIFDVFSKLVFSSTAVYVLIDELELSVRNIASHNKDIALVRDLIIAIDSLNEICSNNGFDIHFYASIRSEVIYSVKSSGYELTKIIEDNGQEVNWFQKGGNYFDNPLLKIVENKIHASERKYDYPISENVWETYFDQFIHGEEIRKYILNNSLYRPRDIIRIMLVAQDQITNNCIFNQELFDKAQQEYSKRMWNELTDELRLCYSDSEINLIFTLFNRISLPFTYDSLTERIDNLGKIYPEMKTFFEKETLINVLNKLYDLGIIGNTGTRMNFIFLECSQIDPLGQMVIHTPLRNFFSVQFK